MSRLVQRGVRLGAGAAGDARSAGQAPGGPEAPDALRSEMHLFVYGTLRSGGRAVGLLGASSRVAVATVQGTLYDIDGSYPALVLAGRDTIHGEIWRCPAGALLSLDQYEGVEAGLFRRVAIRIGEVACWTYVAGPALAHRLTPDQRIPSGLWTSES